MKFLIAVKSCVSDKEKGCHQAIRDTWGKNLPVGVDLLFFVGGENPPAYLESDERYVHVDDSYWYSTPKMLEIVRYGVQKDYDFSCLCDTDTYFDIPRLMRTGFEACDYSGGLSGGQTFGEAGDAEEMPYSKVIIAPTYAYMSGGHGYILSRLAAKIVGASSAPCPEGEDLIVGCILGPFLRTKELTAKNLPDFKNNISVHLGCGFYGGNNKVQRKNAATAIREKHEAVNPRPR